MVYPLKRDVIDTSKAMLNLVLPVEYVVGVAWFVRNWSDDSTDQLSLCSWFTGTDLTFINQVTISCLNVKLKHLFRNITFDSSYLLFSQTPHG